jgi:hypothetical protein
MRRKVFSIWSVLLILVVSIVVLVPGCEGEGEECIGEIEVKATLCDAPWEGDVDYTLTGPGAAAPTVITGTNVTTLFDEVECGNWTCEYVSGGPPGAYLVDITPGPTQEVTSGSTITFTLNFELEQDAWIDFLTWTVDKEPWPFAEVEVFPCQIIDVHFQQGVAGCEGRIVAVNETSWLQITQTGGPAPATVFVVNDLCAVNKTAEPPVEPPEKLDQVPSLYGDPVPPGMPIELPPQVPVDLDVETAWKLVKEIDYIKSINWLGISLFDPIPHPCVLFELVLPIPGVYTFTLVASAEVELVDDDDVNTQNDNTTSPPLFLIVNTLV